MRKDYAPQDEKQKDDKSSNIHDEREVPVYDNQESVRSNKDEAHLDENPEELHNTNVNDNKGEIQD